MIRVLFTFVVAAACLAPLAAESNEVFAFVQKSCVACHNGSVKSGDVDLKSLQTTAKTFEQDREIWEKVVAKLKTGQMPPPGAPRPAEVATTAIARWLESEFARQDRQVAPEAG